MKRLLLILVFCTYGLTHLTACSSGDESAEPEDKIAGESIDGDGELEAGAKDESGSEEKSASLDEGSENEVAGEAGEKEEGDEVAEKEEGDEEEKVAESGDKPQDPLDAMAQEKTNEPPAGDQQAQATDTPPPAVDAPPPGDAGMPVADAAPLAPVAPKVAAPLQKIKDVPFSKGGKLLNTVYIARPGDSLKSVSEKLLGSEDRKKDLVSWNPVLKRGVKPGDKVYYNSPNRPDDADKVLTFYEDNNIPAQFYTSIEGDSIQSVAESILGSKDTWKELWSTNMDLQSKGKLPEGSQIRYWKEDMAPPPVAKVEPPKNTLPPPPPPTQPMAQNNPSPTTMQDPNVPGSMASTTPQMSPPPPSPSKPPGKIAKKQDEDLLGLGLDNMTLLILGGALLVGTGLMLAIKKKKDASRFADGQTQI